MSVKNLKVLLIVLISARAAEGSIVACNVPLLNSFYLTGFENAVHDPMKVCPFVQDKCCTVADEIRMTKLWKERTEPFIKTRYAALAEQMSRIVDTFWPMMSIDIELMILKNVTRRMIPYNYTTCFPVFETMSGAAFEEFATRQDIELEDFYRMKAYFDDPTNSTAFNLSNYTRDQMGDRTWQIPLRPQQLERERRFNRTVMRFLPPAQISFNNVTCVQRQQNVLREFIIVNEPKAKFCLGLYERFLSFDIVQFKYTLKVVKNHLNSFGHYKKTFYCFLCDAYMQRYVSVDKKVVIFSQPFCKTLLKEKEDYIRFLHIIFVEFADSMLQYIHCFETDGSVLTLPYQNFLARFKRRIPLIRRCLAGLDQGDFMGACWFLCNKFSLTKFSTFWEGDLNMVDRVLLAIKSFLRKFRIEIEEEQRFDQFKQRAGGRPVLTTTGNVDGVIIEPMIEKLDPSHILTNNKFYLRARDRFEMFNRTNTTMLMPGNVTTEIDDYLTSIGMPTMSQVRLQRQQTAQWRQQMEELQRLQNMNPEEVAAQQMNNSDVSLVNGLTNRMRNWLPRSRLDPGMYPARKTQLLEQEILEKEKRLDPRKLDLVFLTTELTKMMPKSPKVVEVANISQPVEDISQIFVKSQPTVDINLFDTTLDVEGLNPLRFASMVDYNYNITNLLGEKFAREEVLSLNVLDSFLSVNAKAINAFNLDVDFHIDGYAELMASLNFLPRINKLLKYAKRKGNKKLLREAEKLQTKVLRDHAAVLNTRERVRIAKKLQKLLAQMEAELTVVKMREIRNATADHVNRPFFQENMNGIAHFFTSIFGN